MDRDPNKIMCSLCENKQKQKEQENQQELREQIERTRKREAELNELLSQEKASNRVQQLEVERRQRQLEESTVMIRRLQEDLETAHKRARSMTFELSEREIKAKFEQEILGLKAHIADLEGQLKRVHITEEKNTQLEREKNIQLEKEKNIQLEREKNIQLEKERQIREKESSENAQIKLLKSELEVQRRKCESLKSTIVELDMQCEKLMNKIRGLDSDRKALIAQLAELTENNAKLKQEEKNKEKIMKLESQLSKLRDDMAQKDKLVASLQSQNVGLPKQVQEQRNRELELINENTLLRQNFAECLKKAEDFRDQLKEFTETNTRLMEEMEKNREKSTSLEDQLFELRGEMEQKDKLVAYLQSIVQPKQMQKLPRARSSLLSSESDFLTDLELEYKQCQQLEQQKNQLRINLENRRKILAEKQNESESLPLLREPLAKQQSKSTVTAPLTQTSTTESAGTVSTVQVPGKMRHDIPHRWKRTFVTVISNNCLVCLEGLPYFRHIYRCRDCDMAVHQHCRQVVVNTCGLPSECADFYLDTHSNSTSNEQMTGWVKMLLMGNPMEKWRNAWATIEEHKLSFYDTDQLALQDGVPFISIDLDKEHWRIYNQTTEKPVGGVRSEDMSVLIELRLPNHTLLMLAPTAQAKQRWVQALQHATNRRIFIQRRPSSAMVDNSLLLALEAPQNLSINCTQILHGEWLLIGAQEGLFVTSMQQQQLRAPFQIAGISKVFWMEALPEFDMLLTICGSIRRLMVVHLHQLNRAFKADQQPRVQLTSVSNIEQCHIAVISKPEHNRDKRFVYLATIDSIIILHYVAKLGVFTPTKQFKTEEPCMCICSTPNGFIYGADDFHFVKFENDFSSSSQLMVDNCPFDFPVAVVEISDNEYLLAFHNFGLFVDSHGKRTRSRNVDWEKVPLEFVYTTPYLYIVYCEFLEVVRIAPQIGIESGTLTDDRNMFKCRSAHRTGFGLNPSEVLFVVSSENRVELHSFSRYSDNEQQSVKSVLKRKLNEPSGSGTKNKKH